MGLRESKLCFLPYEEAVKRVTDEEIQRLRLAFKRASGVSGLMVESLFAREVLGDCVPVRVAEQIYTAFGGTTKGINFGNLLCGLVLLTRGTREEKIKFLFNVYTSDGVHVTRESLENAIIASDGGIVSVQVNECFAMSDRLSFDEFAKWLSRNPDVTSLSRWLLIVSNGCSVQLTDSSETPTFYQTLATVTHLQEADIIELEKKYWYLKSTSRTGKFDLETFTRLVSPPIPSIICAGLFKAFDENSDNHIDFREMACGISSCCRGTSSERHHFCFKVFDVDGDGFLSKDEITVMCQTLLEIRQDNTPDKDTNNQFSETDSILMAEEILANCSKDKEGKINFDEYKQWANDHRFSVFFSKLLIQVCHIVLGLKPSTRDIELQVARGWIERENQQGLKPGSVWYLVSMSWWRTWKEHVNYQNTRRSSTGSMKRNGVSPSKATQAAIAKTSVNSAWSYDTLKAKTLGRRESHPVYGNKSVSPANGSVNGHCIPGTDTVIVGPGQIDNTSLIETETRKIPILTGEGGKLKRTVPLSRGRDFEIIPDPVWKALLQWYGGGPALPRTVIVPKHGDLTPELELFPINLRIYRHAPPPTRGGITTWTGVGFGLSSFGFGNNSMTTSHAPPKKYLAFLAAFSRINTLQQVLEYTSGRLRIRVEDLRLWIMEDDNILTLLEEDTKSLEELNITDSMTLLLEVRNRDMSWPEEMSSLASNKSLKEKLNNEPTEKGATGLSNLGNTCFMNSALQCLSNTHPLTQYFTNRCHYYELNRSNPLGMKGHIARRYGDLVEDLWSGSSRSLAPLKLRWTIGRYAPRFNGFQQHDSQEFLSFLLDGLHEDLNRVHDKPYVELKDSDGRPDEIVSQEAWDNHFKRNQSIVVDLFQGQLKSQVRCLQCGYVSARFDPFTFLSLPLPMDNSIYVEIVVVSLSGAVPTKYALLLDNDDKYRAIKKGLSKLCDIQAENLLLVEVYGATVKNIPSDTIKIRSTIAGFLYAYEIPDEQPSPVHKTESQITDKENQQDIEPAVIQQTDECNEIDTRHSSRNSSNNSLKVDENWFNDDNKRKKNTGLLKKFSPKLRKKISPKINGSYKPIKLSRKSSESSESSQSSISNADSGIALNNGQYPNNVPCVCVTETNSALPSNAQDSIINTSSSNAQNCVTNSPVSTNRQNSVINSGSPGSVNGSLTSTSSLTPSGFTFNGFAVAIHRKMMRQDAYFMSHQKNSPSLFGIPVIVPCTILTKQSDLYQSVWIQVARLLSAPPPGDKNAKNGATGEYPFQLRAVQKDGLTCSWCPWYRFCRGCPIQCTDQEYGSRSSFLAIEWDPTTLHLRYQSSLEKTFTEHDSVEKSRKLQTEPIDLYECLTAFTKEEELGEDELWYCNKCKKQRLAVKKLEIWSLPPILVIHLKRFQYVNGHWVKSNKIVNYPMTGFDPSAFLVKRIATSPHNSVTTVNVRSNYAGERDTSEAAAGSDDREQSQRDSTDAESITTTRASSIRSSSQVDVANRSRHSSSSSINSAKALTDVETQELRSPVSSTGDYCTDQQSGCPRFVQEQTQRNQSSEIDEIRNRASSMTFNVPTYKLYAMSCHSGVLGGGHYISYSHNPNGRWYCYNDSSCKECDQSKMHKDSPYMLFYEQESLHSEKFLPKFKDQTPDTNSDDEEYENDVKRMCTIQ